MLLSPTAKAPAIIGLRQAFVAFCIPSSLDATVRLETVASVAALLSQLIFGIFIHIHDKQPPRDLLRSSVFPRPASLWSLRGHSWLLILFQRADKSCCFLCRLPAWARMFAFLTQRWMKHSVPEEMPPLCFRMLKRFAEKQLIERKLI